MGAHRAGRVYPQQSAESEEWYRRDRARRAMIHQRAKVEWFKELKRKLDCAHCGMSFADCPECLDFHHVDPATKDGKIAIVLHGKQWILNEIKKCIPLCANCHRRHHAKEAPPLTPIPEKDRLTPTGRPRTTRRRYGGRTRTRREFFSIRENILPI